MGRGQNDDYTWNSLLPPRSRISLPAVDSVSLTVEQTEVITALRALQKDAWLPDDWWLISGIRHQMLRQDASSKSVDLVEEILEALKEKDLAQKNIDPGTGQETWAPVRYQGV